MVATIKATDNKCIAQSLLHHNTSSAVRKVQDPQDKWYWRQHSSMVAHREVDLTIVTTRAKDNAMDSRIWGGLIHVLAAAVRREMEGSKSQKTADRYCISVSFSFPVS